MRAERCLHMQDVRERARLSNELLQDSTLCILASIYLAHLRLDAQSMKLQINAGMPCQVKSKFQVCEDLLEAIFLAQRRQLQMLQLFTATNTMLGCIWFYVDG